MNQLKPLGTRSLQEGGNAFVVRRSGLLSPIQKDQVYNVEGKTYKVSRTEDLEGFQPDFGVDDAQLVFVDEVKEDDQKKKQDEPIENALDPQNYPDQPTNPQKGELRKFDKK